MRFRLVREFPAEGFHVAVTCRALKVSMSGFSEWSRREPSARNVDDAVPLNPIIDIHAAARWDPEDRRVRGLRQHVRAPLADRPDREPRRRDRGVEFALAEFEVLLKRPNAHDCPVDVEVSELLPVVTLVTDNSGPFRAFRFETLISQHGSRRSSASTSNCGTCAYA